MTAKEYLSRGRDLSMRIEEIEDEKQRLYEAATGTVKSSRADRVQTSPGNSSERKMQLYATMSERLDKEREKLLDTLDKIVALIDSIEDITYRRLLSMRYIELMKWEDIADKMCYNTRHIHRLHTKALSEADKILNER